VSAPRASDSAATVVAADTVAALLGQRPSGDGAALLAGDRSWTWAEHMTEVNQRARWMSRQAGIGRCHVGVLLDNVPEFSFLLAGAALSGQVIVGLNPTRRGEELRRDILHSDCTVIVTDSRHRELIADFIDDLPTVHITDEPGYLDAIALEPDDPVHTDVAPDDLFLLIFTSGTTGAPKAVRCSQGSVARRGRSIAETAGLTPDDTAYIAMPLFHSNAIIAGWGAALASGARTVLRERFSASGLLPDVRRYGVTYFNYVGKPLSYVLATPERPDDADNTLRLAYGNEASDHDIAEFARRFGCEVRDAFGTTEGGLRFKRVPAMPAGSIGVARSDVRVLDPASGQECARAVFDENGLLLNGEQATGELVNMSGGGSFEGYYNNEEANRLRLRDGRYWSGDLAYRDEAGYFFYAGRSEDWLRVDGENLAIGPIERLLARYDGVQLSAVYAVPDPAAGDRVMVALLLNQDVEFDPGHFRDWLDRQRDLGEKWWPTFVRIAAELPSTATNKVIKRRLVAERWTCVDPVWRSPGKGLAYQRVDEQAIAELAGSFAAHGRAAMLRRTAEGDPQ
jgi:fatty-acyl-CoA synthase